MQKEKNLLKRFLRGKASEKEKVEVEGWLDKSVETNKEWKSLGEQDQSEMMRETWKGIRQKITKEKGIRNNKSGRWAWAAAALILLLMTPLYYLWENSPQTGIQLKGRDRWITVSTATGETKKVVLMDGSTVWLNAQSQISYAAEFEGDTRLVNLVGEAYFEVVRNTKKPFVVHAASLTVKVLGTRFDLSDYKEDRSASVAVLSGKVAVQKSNKSNQATVFNKGERLRFDKNEQLWMKEPFNPRRLPAWTQQEIVFYHTKMDQVAHFFKRNYNKQLLFSDKQIEELEVSGDFGKVASMENLLSMICLTINAQYKISGDEIMITLLD